MFLAATPAPLPPQGGSWCIHKESCVSVPASICPCLYVSIHTPAYLHIPAHRHICIYPHISLHIDMHIALSLYIPASMYVCVWVYTYGYIAAYSRVCLDTYIQTQRCRDRCMRGHIIIYTRVYVCAYTRIDTLKKGAQGV